MSEEPRSPTGSESTDPRSEFRSIVDEHAGFLWRALRHLGVRERDIEDVCQDVFLVVHRRLADFRGDSSLRTWIYGIAVRLASEHRRRAQVRREVPVAETPLITSTSDPEGSYENSELRRILLGILEQLDDDKRAVFVLYEIEDLDMKEVARAVDCPLQTAYSRLHAARRFVADAVRERSPDFQSLTAKAGSHGA